MDNYFITNLINEIEDYAKLNNVPIMMKDAISYICKIIEEKNINSVLEVGTAIGYSAINMAITGTNVVTIERDVERYNKALQNIEMAKLEEKIEVIFGDAFDIKESRKFDLILIDAAKGKNKEFIEKFKVNLNENGLIIIDNVDFHGLVGKSEEIKSRNLRSLVRKIERFIDFLNNQNEFEVIKVNVGDGLIILERKIV